MQNDSQKEHMNFFKKEISLQENNSVKIWAMILYSIHQSLGRIKLMHIAAFTVMLLVALHSVDYVQHGDDRAVLNKNQQSFDHQKQLKQSAQQKLQAQIEATKEAAAFKQKVQTIFKISPEQIKAINDYIVKTRNAEVAKLKGAYWTYYFINSHDKSMNMGYITSTIHTQINLVNKFYNTRIVEVNSNYEFIKAGQTDLIYDTHDKSSVIDKIITWDVLTKTQTATLMESTTAIVVDSTKYLSSPIKLNKYLEENKAVIESSKIFDYS